MTRSRSSTEREELYCATCEGTFSAGELCPNDGTRLVRLIAATDPLIGREIDGRFTILEKLGQGGMGTVYRARQHSMGREVAIKVLPTGMVGDATSIKRFLREAKLASRLTHPNIVGVLDFGQTRDGVFYLAMELVTGETLQAMLAREHRLELPRLLRIALQLCDALDGAHALPIVHRDLKPSNVMVLAQGRDHIKVLDFGLAKSLLLETTTGTTSTGALLGTPMFMPPEVAIGRPADARSDLYSLGCMLYMMGTGEPPFVTDSVLGMIAMHGTMEPPAMSGVPAAIAAVVDRLLEKDPDLRYQTAADARSALEDAYHELRMTTPRFAAIESFPPGGATPLPGRLAPRALAASAAGHAAVAVSAPAPGATVHDAAIARPAARARAPRRVGAMIGVVIAAMAIAAAAGVAVALWRSDRAERGDGASSAASAPPPQRAPGSATAVAVDPGATRAAHGRAGEPHPVAGLAAGSDGRAAAAPNAPPDAALDARPADESSAPPSGAADAHAPTSGTRLPAAADAAAQAPGEQTAEPASGQAGEPASKRRRAHGKAGSGKSATAGSQSRPAPGPDEHDDGATSTSSARPGAGSSSPF